ncbi:unnamed protein product [Protopolystoma xenopodis]|uniref:Uncharacterized protein n=1 Tax=Protopolystoma xenopodis TaxID=117903 RepID=A0A3S5BE66_9PLAT|nr:unnamed protein product [Protopolystoma xenopodis]
MKLRFSSFDLLVALSEIRHILLNHRVINIYDINTKTYLIKFSGPSNDKHILLLQAGSRIHITDFEWPKNLIPSGFTAKSLRAKLRKHIKNKRLTEIVQLGFDRVVDLQFGSGEVAFHLIFEFYDKV